jgi:DNA polymerase-1
VEILDVLVAREDDMAAKAQAVLMARGWLSVASRYYTPYAKLCDAQGVLRASLNLHGTISGRLSCSNPNLQAVARQTEVFKVKDVFIARPGYTMISMDYSQAEMRIACFYAKEETMAGLIRSGVDVHSSTANMLGIPRDIAKRINFGTIYGIGKRGLSRQLHIPEKTSQEYLTLYHNLYPGFRQLMNACEARAERDGAIRMWTGRMRHYDAKNPSRTAMPNLVQGAVAEIMRVAISRAYPVMNDLGGYMLLQVHDQIIFEVPDENLWIAMPVIRDIMQDFDFDPRMTVDIKYGKRWGKMTKWKEENP